MWGGGGTEAAAEKKWLAHPPRSIESIRGSTCTYVRNSHPSLMLDDSHPSTYSVRPTHQREPGSVENLLWSSTRQNNAHSFMSPCRCRSKLMATNSPSAFSTGEPLRSSRRSIRTVAEAGIISTIRQVLLQARALTRLPARGGRIHGATRGAYLFPPTVSVEYSTLHGTA
eukprot:COSAG03_NODE_3_length_28214_cov_23.750987_10_plen_170_part_00